MIGRKGQDKPGEKEGVEEKENCICRVFPYTMKDIVSSPFHSTILVSELQNDRNKLNSTSCLREKKQPKRETRENKELNTQGEIQETWVTHVR